MLKMNLITTKLLLAAGIAVLPLVAPAKVVDLSGQWNIRHAAADSATATQLTLAGLYAHKRHWKRCRCQYQVDRQPVRHVVLLRTPFEKYRKPGNIKFPFFLTPDKEYIGHAEYSKTVDIPADWKGTDITLMLERPHIETEVYVNSHLVGKDSTPERSSPLQRFKIHQARQSQPNHRARCTTA